MVLMVFMSSGGQNSVILQFDVSSQFMGEGKVYHVTFAKLLKEVKRDKEAIWQI